MEVNTINPDQFGDLIMEVNTINPDQFASREQSDLGRYSSP